MGSFFGSILLYHSEKRDSYENMNNKQYHYGPHGPKIICPIPLCQVPSVPSPPGGQRLCVPRRARRGIASGRHDVPLRVRNHGPVQLLDNYDVHPGCLCESPVSSHNHWNWICNLSFLMCNDDCHDI